MDKGHSKVKLPRPNTGEMEVAVANLINPRLHVIIPNIYWGINLFHECDLLVIDKVGRFTEIEIKISASDLKRDFKKWHGHQNSMIGRLVYAVPAHLRALALEIVPIEFGLIVVDTMVIPINSKETYIRFKASWVRRVRFQNGYIAPKPEIVSKVKFLGCLRIWNLKRENLRLQKDLHILGKLLNKTIKDEA